MPDRVEVMTLVPVHAQPSTAEVDLLFVPVCAEETVFEELPGLDEATAGEWTRMLDSREFGRRPYETVSARVVDRDWQARHVVFVGAGPRGGFDAERLRRIGATCGAIARARSASSLAVVVRAGMPVEAAAAAFADGLIASTFDAGIYKSDQNAGRPTPVRALVVAPNADPAALASAVSRGRVIGEASNFARALVNEPGNVLTPAVFADRVAAAAVQAGLGVEVLDEQQMSDLGMRLLLAVAKGSDEPPRMMVLRHEPPGAAASPLLAFVGKGVTFDAGGISIKPADGMDRMKDDMGGGAAAAAALIALARLEAPTRALAVIPLVENMPSGRAMRPGDVVIGASGTSVEIVNTDAEGRLILADALWYAERVGATHVVDIATLTGACVVALGRHVAGLFGAPDSWVDTVRSAAARAGDRVWPLPIYEETRDQLKSEIADLLNAGGRPGGACTAAAFLREFVGGAAWAHLDIAGPVWADTRKPYQPKGPTGAAVRTLVELGCAGLQVSGPGTTGGK